VSKITLPHRKQVFRILDNEGKFTGADAVTLADEQDVEIMYHPLYPLKSLSIKKYNKEPLLQKVITEIYFCGLAADICVYYTIKDSLKEGFSAILIEDASRPLSNDAFTSIKKELTKMGVRIINSNEILSGYIQISHPDCSHLE
jgi:nicotinamidase-related amidase